MNNNVVHIDYAIDEKTEAEINNKFTYHPPKGNQPERYQNIRTVAKELCRVINKSCPPSRERSLAITKLEELVMWSCKAIANNE